jgi:hypothetical protein
MDIDRERNPAEADQRDAEFLFAQNNPRKLKARAPTL